jgi:hypothetical protein
MTISPLAGRPVPKEMLVNLAELERADAVEAEPPAPPVLNCLSEEWP